MQSQKRLYRAVEGLCGVSWAWDRNLDPALVLLMDGGVIRRVQGLRIHSNLGADTVDTKIPE